MANTKSILCLALFLGLMIPRCARGQEWGTIAGTVTDPSGGTVPSAQVALTEADTGFTRTAITNGQGGYVLPSLRPTLYTLSIEARGFRKYIHRNIILEANQTLTVNVRLELGQTRQTVTVQAAPTAVNTTTGTLSEVINESRVVGLPLNGRNAASLTLLVAGVVSPPSADCAGCFGTPENVPVSINGSLQNQTNYELDGANNNDTLTDVNMPFPFPDALQEFSVQTSNYSAQYGENAGGVVNIVTKSGTNELHGDAFEFVRNAVLNSRNFFAAQTDPLKRNQFGGTIGGPVVIPGVYNGRDHTFFFFGYQGTRVSEVHNGLSAFLPAPAMMNGDFSAFLSATNPSNPLHKVVQLKNPITRKPAPGDILSTSEFDPAAVKMMTGFMPLSAESPDGEVRYNRPASTTDTEYVARVDHSFSAKDMLTVREFYDENYAIPFYQPGNLLTLVLGTPAVTNNILAHETHIFSPNLLNDFHVSYARVAVTEAPPAGQPNLRDFGVNIPYQPTPNALNGFGVAGFFNPPATATVHIPRNTFSYSDHVSWVLGRHNVALGGLYQRLQDDIRLPLQSAGSFTFNGAFTGTAISDFLTGKVYSFAQGQGQFYDGRNNFIGVYAQDSFRATRHLTLDYGLRYEPYFPWHDDRGRIEYFDLSGYYAGVHSIVFPNASTGELFPGDPGVPRDGTTGDFTDFAPRLGFAYALGGKMSVRGGAGVFYDSATTGATLFPMAQESPWASLTALPPPPGPLSNPLAIGTPEALPSPLPAAFPPPSNFVFPPYPDVSTFDPSTHFHVPVTYNWNLTVERQLTPGTLVRAAYVGHRATNIGEQVNLNPAVYIPGSTLSVDQRKLLPGIGNIYMGSQAVNASYNALQFTLEKRASHGLTLLANYTYSKSLDDHPYPMFLASQVGGGTSSPLPWYMSGQQQFNYGPSEFDHTHTFVASYVWQLPKLTGENPTVRRIFGDWEWTGIVRANSGSPLTIEAAGDPSQTGLGSERAVLVGSPYGSGACGNAAPCVNDLNPSSFQLPAIGTFGTMGKGALRGPDYFDWDMGVFKNIPLGERWRLQFRAEFFNTFNRVNFSNPRGTVGGAGFGSILSSNDPRIGQLALKVFF